jgi:hypothetical protein
MEWKAIYGNLMVQKVYLVRMCTLHEFTCALQKRL